MDWLRPSCSALLAAWMMVPGGFADDLPQDVPESHPLSVSVGKSVIVDSKADIVRVSVAAPGTAATVAVSSREILVNGLAPGETSLLLWQADGERVVYDVTVHPSFTRLDFVRQQVTSEPGSEKVTIDLEGDTVFLRGTVKDVVSAERAVNIAGALGKVVNLLYVAVPAIEAQVMLKVRFANVERSVSRQIGVDLVSTGHLSTPGSTSTGQFTLGDALNMLVFRKDFNLSATLTALQNNNLVEILAEPNLLAIDGHVASFVAGGEYPYPTLQGGGVGATGGVTIVFREFGVKIKFLPNVTAGGTIRLHVTPEVSSLDFANGLIYQGFRVPALVTRRVDTEVELESGQSFAIAGLLDNRVTDELSKVPGIGDIPILGKLFQSRTRKSNNSELLVIITPELVRPIPAGTPLPDLPRPLPFLESDLLEAPRTPGTDITGPVPASRPHPAIPLESLLKAIEVQHGTAGLPPQTQPAPALPPAPQENPVK